MFREHTLTPLYEKLTDAESIRNKTLSLAKEYDKVAPTGTYESVGLHAKVKNVVDTMPLFNKAVADKMLQKTLDTSRIAIMSSIRTKVAETEAEDVDKVTKFVKTQKKDILYD